MLSLKIVSPEKIVYTGEVESVVVPGTAGEFEILSNHAPIISSLEPGVVSFTSEEGTTSINVRGGFVEVQKNKVSVCVEV